jgi:chaperonin GroES
MKFRPLRDCVVVRRLDAEEKAAGVIIIPDTAEEKPSQREIAQPARVAAKLIPMDRKLGDRVLFE